MWTGWTRERERERRDKIPRRSAVINVCIRTTLLFVIILIRVRTYEYEVICHIIYIRSRCIKYLYIIYELRTPMMMTGA